MPRAKAKSKTTPVNPEDTVAAVSIENPPLNEPEVPEVPEAPKNIVVEAQNPTPEEMAELCDNIKVNHDFEVDVKPVRFNFKKRVDKVSNLETVRESVELAIAIPSVQGVVAILEAGGKELDLLMDAIEDVVVAVARDIIAEDTTINASNFPINKTTWKSIANTPKKLRSGGGIPKETWEAFGQNYQEVMPSITNKSQEATANMVRILVAKLSGVKTNIPVLELVIQQLAIYAEHSPQFEEYAECIDFLLEKADGLVNVSPEDLLAGL